MDAGSSVGTFRAVRSQNGMRIAQKCGLGDPLLGDQLNTHQRSMSAEGYTPVLEGYDGEAQ